MSVAKEEHVEPLKLTLAPLAERRLNTKAHLSVAADCVHLFITTVYHLLMAATNENSVQRW